MKEHALKKSILINIFLIKETFKAVKWYASDKIISIKLQKNSVIGLEWLGQDKVSNLMHVCLRKHITCYTIAANGHGWEWRATKIWWGVGPSCWTFLSSGLIPGPVRWAPDYYLLVELIRLTTGVMLSISSQKSPLRFASLTLPRGSRSGSSKARHLMSCSRHDAQEDTRECTWPVGLTLHEQLAIDGLRPMWNVIEKPSCAISSYF